MSKPQVTMTLPTGETKVVRQYQFPVKFSPISLDVNGAEVRAAKTAGKGRSYTYFELDGVSYYVEGHLDVEAKYTVTFPEGFVAKELKPQRIVSNKPKKEKAPKAEATETSPDANGETPAWQPGTASKRRARRAGEGDATQA